MTPTCDPAWTGTAIDTMLVIVGPDTYHTLVQARGYSMDEFERWVGGTLIAAVLGP